MPQHAAFHELIGYDAIWHCYEQYDNTTDYEYWLSAFNFFTKANFVGLKDGSRTLANAEVFIDYAISLLSKAVAGAPVEKKAKLAEDGNRTIDELTAEINKIITPVSASPSFQIRDCITAAGGLGLGLSVLGIIIGVAFTEPGTSFEAGPFLMKAMTVCLLVLIIGFVVSKSSQGD